MTALDLTTLAADCEARAAAGGAQFVEALYSNATGFFAYGAELDGTGRADDIMFRY